MCSFRITTVSHFLDGRARTEGQHLGTFSVPGWFCHTQHFGTQPSLIGCLWAPPSGERWALQPSKRPTPARKGSAKELVTSHRLNHQSISQAINQSVGQTTIQPANNTTLKRILKCKHFIPLSGVSHHPETASGYTWERSKKMGEKISARLFYLKGVDHPNRPYCSRSPFIIIPR